MIHDYATSRKNPSVPVRVKRNPVSLARVCLVSGALVLGTAGLTHVVMAVADDLRQSAAEVAERKQEERARKAQAKLEKQRLLDEERYARKAAAAREIAEKRSVYGFYDALNDSMPIPLQSDAYSATVPIRPSNSAAKVASSETLYSLQTSLHRDLAEARQTVSRLDSLGFKPQVEEVKVKAGGIVYRVTVGPFKALEDAMAARDALHGQHYFAQVFRE
jgi:cell division protein FtsN